LRTHLKRHLSELPEGADEGFTLIELLVVLLILGILLAIAIPTFLTVTKSATNTAVSSNLQTALTGADTYFTQNSGNYDLILTSTTVSNLNQDGTGLTYGTAVTGATVSTAAKLISVLDPTTDTTWQNILLAASNGSTRCYAIADQKTTGGLGTTSTTTSAIGTYYGWYATSSTLTCTASNALTNVSTAALAKPGAWTTSGSFPS
jgi:type IV pilus assembly protein PilA